MTARSRLGEEGYGVRRSGIFSGKTPDAGGGPHPVGVITRLALDGYGARRYRSFAGKTQSIIVVADAIDPSLGRGGGATRKQLKKFYEAEDKFQRRKRKEEEALFATMEGRASLKHTAEIGGPKVIFIDDDDDDMDIMIWATQ